ncbi:MAG: DUF481 domain-containing protein [Calditrichaeota bacterium]|nr:DUF481 domain-containing protein [Calditrichota bacterium]
MKIILFITLFALSFSNLFAQVNTEKYRSSHDSLGLSLQSEIGATVQKGNVDFQEFSIESVLSYKLQSSTYLFVVSGDFGWEDRKSFSNSLLFHLRNIHDLSARFKLELFVQLDYDKEHLLISRKLTGAGLRSHLFSLGSDKLWIGNSIFFEQEKYDLPKTAKHDSELNNLRISTYLTFKKKIKEYINWDSVVYYQPMLDQLGDYKIIGETGLTFEIEDQISLAIGFNYRFDSIPADGIKKNDYKTEMGLVLSL